MATNHRTGARPALPLTVRSLLALTMLTFAALQPAVAQDASRVESFSPEGSVRQVRQVAVRFSDAMTALGDPGAADPFAIDCSAAGRGSWVDSRHWVFDFDADLPAGVACTFTLRPGLTTLAGAPLTGTRTFRFDTGGPAIRASLPRATEWQRIDENQIFILATDAPATLDSVRAHAYCVIPNLAERIPVRVLEGEERATVLAQRRQLGYSYYTILWADARQSTHRIRDRSVEQAEQSLTVLSCARTLPPDSEVHLIWGAGITSASGIETSAEQSLAFKTRPDFRATLDCERVKADAGCLPNEAIRVNFTAPVPRDVALAVRLQGPDGSMFEPRPRNLTGESPTLDSIVFAPTYLEHTRFELHLPADLRDDAGRSLDNAARFPLPFETDAFPALAKFSAEFGILEANEGGVLPITLRNLRDASTPRAVPGRKLRVASDPVAIARWFDNSRRRRSGEALLRDNDGAEPFDLPVPEDAREAEVIGIPLGRPGFYVVDIASPRLGAALNERPSVYHVDTMALVTNLAVHFKRGRERSLLWVTRLDNGKPVPNAELTLTNVCTGANLWSGRSDEQGTAYIGPDLLSQSDGYGHCARGSNNPIYLASARVGDDLGFTLSTWTQGIEPYQFGLPYAVAQRPFAVHTVLDRPLFRAGELVSMKHFIRRKVMAGFDTAAAQDSVPVTICHVGSDDCYANDIAFDATGTALQGWRIPPGAKLGTYTIRFKLSGSDYPAGQFKVQQFRVPVMRAIVQGPAGPQAQPRSVTLDLHLGYLSGGGASGVPVTLRFSRRPAWVIAPDYQKFNFTDQKISVGRERVEYGFDPEAEPDATEPRAETRTLTLDKNGAARIELPISPIDRPEQLIAELDYPDANGEIATASNRVDLRPASLTVGIAAEAAGNGTRRIQTQVVVLDLAGKPVARQPVEIKLYAREQYGYRKRLVGGFYGYENYVETRPLDASCSGRSDARGLVLCDLLAPISGQVLLRAEIADTAGNRAGAVTQIWLAGDDDAWHGSSDTDRMDVLPERPEYESGDTAKFQVQLPFRSATALVAVEREGIVDRFVTELRSSDPVIRVPIKPEYAPNVYVSVLAVRGRVGEAQSRKADAARAQRELDPVKIDGGQATALIDLSKPAFRLGIAEIRVGWRPNRLDVAVTTDRRVYRVRDAINVTIKAKRADGAALPAGTEVALAVVDEGLLELAPNPSWNLLDAMMGRRSDEVWTATAQMQVVGKRHYGRKALPHGGGGGRNPARELFDTLLAWRGRVVLDEHGEATVTVPGNDALTSFRIVAVAHGGGGLFGTGSASVTTMQDLMLLSGLPQLVREGDTFAATITARNASKAPLEVAVAATATGLTAPLGAQRLTLEPGAARDLTWSVPVPVGITEITWDFDATATNGASDRLKTRQDVVPAIPVRVLQATLAPLDQTLTVPLARPADAIADRGGIDLLLLPSLTAGAQDGVLSFLREYRYTGIEQMLSKAVGLRDAELWRAWVERLPAYMDSDGLLKYFPIARLQGEDSLTSYVLAIADEAGWNIPESSRKRLIDALTAFVTGKLARRSALPTSDLAIRRLAAIAALARYGVADARQLDSIPIEPNLWPTSALLDWITILQRMPGIAEHDSRLAEAVRILRARFDFRGTTLTLSTERDDALWWLMVSTDANAARALGILLRESSEREDLPRLMRGLLGRQVQGHWNTTVANAWGILALERFSAAFEAKPINGTTQASYAGREQRTDWGSTIGAVTNSFAWSDAPAPIVVAHQGTGTPWALLRTSAAMPVREPLTRGYRIKRTISAVEQQSPDRWTRGDLVRVHLDLDAQSDMTWVVVDDPIPAGATILGSGLGGQSSLARADERDRGWTGASFEERRADAFRAYYRWVPKGQWSIEYTLRLNNPGTFVLPPTHVEAMYAPEMFGELPNAPLTVAPTP